MAAKELFEHESILRLIEDLKTDGVKFDKRDPLFDYAEYMDHLLGDFREATGADEALLFDILKNDRADLYNYIFHQGYDKGVFGLVMPLMHLIDFAVLRHFPDKLEDFMSRFLYSKAPKEARKRIKQYNETFGIVPEKLKKAAVPKPRAVTPAIETGLKYSEYDEDYYAMLLERGREGNVIVNPTVGTTWEQQDGLTV